MFRKAEVNNPNLRRMRREILEAARALEKVGAMDRTRLAKITARMVAVDRVPEYDPMSAVEIRALREKIGVSQAVFAQYLGVTKGLVSKWECGQKQPGKPSRIVLGIVRAKGLKALEDAA